MDLLLTQNPLFPTITFEKRKIPIEQEVEKCKTILGGMTPNGSL